LGGKGGETGRGVKKKLVRRREQAYPESTSVEEAKDNVIKKSK